MVEKEEEKRLNIIHMIISSGQVTKDLLPSTSDRSTKCECANGSRSAQATHVRTYVPFTTTFTEVTLYKSIYQICSRGCVAVRINHNSYSIMFKKAQLTRTKMQLFKYQIR